MTGRTVVIRAASGHPAPARRRLHRPRPGARAWSACTAGCWCASPADRPVVRRARAAGIAPVRRVVMTRARTTVKDAVNDARVQAARGRASGRWGVGSSDRAASEGVRVRPSVLNARSPWPSDRPTSLLTSSASFALDRRCWSASSTGGRADERARPGPRPDRCARAALAVAVPSSAATSPTSTPPSGTSPSSG